MSRQDDVKNLINHNFRRLQKLKEKRALEGMSVDPKILIEIEDIEALIEKLQIELKTIESRTGSTPKANTPPSEDIDRASSEERTPPKKPDLNPFIFNRPLPPALFVGRAEIIKRCRDRLAGPVRASIAISGEHGMGKTSLLHYLMHLAQEEQWGQPYTRNIFIHLDCQKIERFTPTRFWQRVLELLADSPYSSSLQERINSLRSQQEIDTFDMERLLKWLNRQELTIVLMLDSFERIVQTATTTTTLTVIGDFLAGLRALANQPEGALTMLTATPQHLDLVCHHIVKHRHDSQFYNNFIFESLPPFNSADIEVLLARALANHSAIVFGQPERNLLAAMAGAHPALLQMAAFHIFEALRQGHLNEQSRAKIVEDFDRQAGRQYFSRFWQKSTLLEQSLFVLIILTNVLLYTSLQLDIGPEEIQLLLRRFERNLDDLIRGGLVSRTAGGYQIFSSMFSRWIVQEVSAKSEELTERAKTLNEEPLRRAWQTFIRQAPYVTRDIQTGQLVERKHTSRHQKPLPRPVDETEEPFLPARYQQQEIIGQGAYGIVYKAFDTVLDRMVAIKRLNSLLTMPSNDVYQSLLKEARTTSKLQHPNIVTIYDITEVDHQICLVMEYLEGQTLGQLLQKKRRLPLKRVITLLEQAASALDYAHANEVIHRDIKPANLMITRRGLRLTDFGIAKILNDPQTGDSTGVKGTVNYMSPEQINQQVLDGRSDIFSLATVAFEMLSGALPWAGETLLQVMNNIAAADVSPRSLNEFKVPHAAALDRVFRKALAKNREERYANGVDFIQALKKVITAASMEREPDYNTAAIRDLLKAAFSDQELDHLCYDHFRPVYQTFTDEMGFDKKIQNLLDYCDRREQMAELLHRIKEHNLAQYRNFERRLKVL